MCKNANIRKYIDEHDALKKDVENRYDIHGKRIFETNDKFFLCRFVCPTESLLKYSQYSILNSSFASGLSTG